jgi:hypothetical protein
VNKEIGLAFALEGYRRHNLVPQRLQNKIVSGTDVLARQAAAQISFSGRTEERLLLRGWKATSPSRLSATR